MVNLYFIFVILSSFFAYLCPPFISRIGSLCREMIFLFLLGKYVLNVVIFPTKNHFSKLDLSFFAYFIFVFFYSLFIQDTTRFFECLLIYLSGPLFFLVCEKERFPQKDIKNISLFLFFYILVNLLIYPVQDALVLVSSVDPQVIYKHLYRNGEIRFFGLTFMPTVMAFFCLLFVSLCFLGIKKKYLKKIIGFVGLYLTKVRLFFPGIIIGVLPILKKKTRYFFSFGFFFLLFFVSLKLLNSDEISLVIHFNDLFVKGPKLVIEYFYGIGLGNISAFGVKNQTSLESDIYLYSIQFGLLGALVYINIFICLFLFFINSLKKNKNKYNCLGLFLLITFFVGSWFLPLTLQRPLCNVFWGIEALCCNEVIREEKIVT